MIPLKEIIMVYQTLIIASGLVHMLTAQDWAIVDCRFSLSEPERGVWIISRHMFWEPSMRT